ncbi:d-alanyl-D-alanine carboxypeptidase [Ruminococcus sp. CAG:55]|nr:d-alanyl-D-alanine carboxypeptidase [Ruminococcus sp. CAG:55]
MSARDIALMSRELMTRYPQIKDYCTVWMENITHTTARGSSEFGLTNTNKLIRQYEYATGLKTGSTGKAKFCVSATASKNGVDLIAVIMGAEDSKSRFKDAVTLLNYGFGKCQIYKAKERKLPVVLVKGGKEDHLKIQYEEGFTYVDTEGSDLSKVEEVTEIPDEVKAPVKKGETVGRICYRINGKEIGSVNLIASTPVEKADFGDYLKKIWKKLL